MSRMDPLNLKGELNLVAAVVAFDVMNFPKRKSRSPSHEHAGCAKASGSASCSPCRNGPATAAPSADRLLPTDTASRRSLETCAARNSLDQAPHVRPRLSGCRES